MIKPNYKLLTRMTGLVAVAMLTNVLLMPSQAGEPEMISVAAVHFSAAGDDYDLAGDRVSASLSHDFARQIFADLNRRLPRELKRAVAADAYGDLVTDELADDFAEEILDDLDSRLRQELDVKTVSKS